MKLTPALLLSLTLCTTLGATSNASEINMSWQWQSTDGQRKHFQLTTDDQVMAASRHEMSLLKASSPIRWRRFTPTSARGSTTAST